MFAPYRLLKKDRNKPEPLFIYQNDTSLLAYNLEGGEGACSINLTKWLVRACLSYLDKV